MTKFVGEWVMSSTVFVLMSVVFMALYFGEMHGIQPTVGTFVGALAAMVAAMISDVRRFWG